MNGIVSFYLLTVVHLFTETRTVSSKLMNFCYFTNWSNKLASFDARFDIRDINVTLCSHLIYAFAKIDASNVRLSPTQNDDDNGQLVNKKGRYFDFNKLKIEHPNLVTLLSIGGAWAGSGGFVSIVRSPETMKLFSRNVAIYLRDRDFDGIDIDWEWPGDTYRNKYTTLLEIMRCEFEKESNRTSKKRLLISITVAAWEEVITSSYNISSISGYVDYIQIMAYDFHGRWSNVTSFSSPLFSRLSNPGFHQQLSQAWAVDRWISEGAPRNKLVMGLTSTAISFALSNRTLNDVGSPVDGAGKKGPYLGVEGHVTYYRVCEMIKYGAIHRWDDEQKMAYAYLDDQWVGYGNPKSMKEKVKFAYSRGIAGVMFWTLDQDDFLGYYCNDGEYPLLTAIHNAIHDLAPTQSQFVDDVSTITTHSTTPKDFRLHISTDKSGLDVQLIPTSTATGSGPGISKLKSTLKNFCYFTNWSNKFASFDARFDIRDINVTLCSHLIYAFAKIDALNVRLTPSQNDDDNGQLVNKKGRYFDFNKLKIENPNLVTLLSIGGAWAGSGGFVSIVRSPETMKLFSRNVAIYLRDRDFDGIVIDWEWPDDIYRNKFTQLLKEMRSIFGFLPENKHFGSFVFISDSPNGGEKVKNQALTVGAKQIMKLQFEQEAFRTGKKRLLISIAVAVGEETITNSYNISSISRDVDYIQIMAYDFHGPWSDVTSFTAPLFSRISNPRFNQQLSQAWAVDRWISGGAPRNKLILGLTSTAISFSLSNRTVTDVGSPVDGPGNKGPYLGSNGHVTYYRVCEMIKNGAIHRWDDEQKMAYAYLEDQWVGYSNPKSMKEKVKFAYSRGIAGVMFWTLDQDDFLGHYCNNGEYPLLTAIYNAINELAPTQSQFVDDVSTSSTHSSTPKDFRLHNSTDKSGLDVKLIRTSTKTVGSGSGISKPKSKLKMFCYFTNWSNKLASFDARFDIRDINVTLCSHLIYAFANIDASNVRLSPTFRDDDNGQLVNKKGRYFDFNKLKIEHPNLVTLLSIGGASAGSGGFVSIVRSPETMKLFSRNVAIYLRDRDFDGIDIDWEWPNDIYRNNYTQLLKIMRHEFEQEAVRTGKKRLLISIDVAVGEETITNSYNIFSISRNVDYIQIMAYDFHGPWSDVTSFTAPLFSRISNPRFNQQLSQAWAVDRWISGGAPRNKLIMGLTSTATSFTLSNRTVTDVGSPVDGPGKKGPYLGNKGHVTYYRVCEMIKYGAIHRWDDEQKMAYAYLDDQWVGYGNPKSMKEKVKFAYSRGIAGVMFWTLDQDDFLGYYCNNGKYPLLTAIYNAINELAPTPSQFVDDVSTSTTLSTTPIDLRVHNRKIKKGMKCNKIADNGSMLSEISYVLLLCCLKLFLLF